MPLIEKAAEEASPELPRRYLVSEFLRMVVGLHHGSDDDPFTSLTSGIHKQPQDVVLSSRLTEEYRQLFEHGLTNRGKLAEDAGIFH